MLSNEEIISRYRRVDGTAKHKFELVCDFCGCGSSSKSRAQVKQVLQEQNLYKYTAKGVDLALEAKNIQKMFDDGMSKTAIADKYGTAGGVLNTIIKIFDIKTTKTVKNKPENEKKSQKTEKTVKRDLSLKRVAITGSKNLKIDDCKANTQRYLENVNKQKPVNVDECEIPFVTVPGTSEQVSDAFEKLGSALKTVSIDAKKALEKVDESLKNIEIPTVSANAENIKAENTSVQGDFNGFCITPDTPTDDIDIFKLLEDTQGELATMQYCVCSAIEHLLMNDRRNGHEDIVQAYKCLAKYNELAENVLHNR